MTNLLEVHAIPVLEDNYTWIACNGPYALIVDPGEAEPVAAFIEKEQKKVRGILITHTHQDHIGGVPELMHRYSTAFLYTSQLADGLQPDILVEDQSQVRSYGFDQFDIQVRATPGHCNGHVSYIGGGHIFCGDAIFSAGCGRLFDGDASDLAKTVAVFDDLAEDIKICCGHEYTLANIEFALAVEPDNQDLIAWQAKAKELREAGQPTLPTTVGHERLCNPFLRADQATVIEAASNKAGRELQTKTEVLGALRSWKDSFK